MLLYQNKYFVYEFSLFSDKMLAFSFQFLQSVTGAAEKV